MLGFGMPGLPELLIIGVILGVLLLFCGGVLAAVVLIVWSSMRK